VTLCITESAWEPPAEGFLSVAEQEAGEKKKNKDKERSVSKKKTPMTGTKAKRKKIDKEGGIDEVDDDEGEAAEPAPPVRGEFEPFMMETTRIGTWRRVEAAM